MLLWTSNHANVATHASLTSPRRSAVAVQHEHEHEHDEDMHSRTEESRGFHERVAQMGTQLSTLEQSFESQKGQYATLRTFTRDHRAALDKAQAIFSHAAAF